MGPGKLNKLMLIKAVQLNESLNAHKVATYFDQLIEHQRKLSKIDCAHSYN